jgi:hypothetical protein
MDFLDSLENSLKSLESREERSGADQERRRRDQADAVAAGPWADQLKTSEYTRTLFDQAALTGHRIRAKIYMAWIDSTLRLEAKGRVLELRPTAGGILSEFTLPDGQAVKEKLDLNGNPQDLLNRWLALD